MPNVPCKECIVFPMCRNRYLKSKRAERSPLANLYILIDKCEPLDDYLFENHNGRSHRIYETIDILTGEHHETAM